MIYTVEGNLLTSDCNIIAHQANCFNVMGSGVAKQIRSMYPEAYIADRDFPLPPEKRLGHCSYVQSSNKVVIFNLYGQYSYGRGRSHTDIRALNSALLYMLEILDANNVPKNAKIGLPNKIGCVRGGGDWSTVYKMLEEIFMDRDLYLYNYTPK